MGDGELNNLSILLSQGANRGFFFFFPLMAKTRRAVNQKNIFFLTYPTVFFFLKRWRKTFFHFYFRLFLKFKKAGFIGFLD